MCPPEEARTLACDLLLQDFICLAIVNPERYGVTGDLPIPDKARINLMQIAQQLQRKVMTPDRHRGDFLTRMVEEVLTLDSGDTSQNAQDSFKKHSHFPIRSVPSPQQRDNFYNNLAVTCVKPFVTLESSVWLVQIHVKKVVKTFFEI